MLKDEGGMITVYVSLIFLVLMGAALCVLEGMRSYTESALAEDAMKGAGNYVLANYDKPLYDNYHVFFMDPREKKYMVSDGLKYISEYLEEESFFQFSCNQLEVTEEKTAVDEDGLYLKSQIREWMKYREVADVGNALKKFFSSSSSDSSDQLLLPQTDFAAAQEAEDEAQRELAEQEENGSGTELAVVGEDSENTGSEEEAQWTGLTDTLSQILKTGILYYAIDDAGSISNLSVSKDDFPSVERKQSSTGSGGTNWITDSFSFSSLTDWIDLLAGVDVALPDINALADEMFMLQYIDDCFSCYTKPKKETEKSALKYETEYLIAGKSTDLNNLKSVADKILLLRFVTNYAYLSMSPSWKSSSNAIATLLSGLVGLPIARKAVQVLMTAAVSFGESMLDMHALYDGKKVPVVKTKKTWTLTLTNAVSKLATKGSVKEGSINVKYEDYLKLFLATDLKTTRTLYRMMDVMQANTALEENGFLMKEALFSFRWEGEFRCSNWFSFFPGAGVTGMNGFSSNLEQVNTY